MKMVRDALCVCVPACVRACVRVCVVCGTSAYAIVTSKQTNCPHIQMTFPVASLVFILNTSGLPSV